MHSGAIEVSSIVSSITGGLGLTHDPVKANIANPVTQAQVAAGNAGAASGVDAQQAFLQAVQGQNGLQNQSQVYGQLQGVANGTGPNPAQAQLAQATGANVANQAALMAGQRGASQNAGLIARQAAMQGANIQQNAAGQAATLQANQSLNAINAAGNMANQQANQQAQATQGYSNAALQQQSNLNNAQAQYNNAELGQAGQMNQVNQNNAAVTGQLIGNLTGAAGAAMTGVPTAAPKGPAPSSSISGIYTAAEGGQIGNNVPQMPMQAQGPMDAVSFFGHAPDQRGAFAMATGGAVPALLSPGERYLAPNEVKQVAAGQKSPMEAGKVVPGTPKVDGAKNSYANDTVKATLSEGGIVIPRSVTMSADADRKALDFVHAIMAKSGQGMNK